MKTKNNFLFNNLISPQDQVTQTYSALNLLVRTGLICIGLSLVPLTGQAVAPPSSSVIEMTCEGALADAVINSERGWPLQRRSSLRLMTFNAQELTLIQEDKNNSAPRPAIASKSKAKIKEIQSIIQKNQPDIVLLQEVLNQTSLDLLNSKFLDNKYETLFVPGHQETYHHVAYLIRKTLRSRWSWDSLGPLKFEHSEGSTLLYNRDLPILHLSSPDQSRTLFVLNLHGISGRKKPDQRLFQSIQDEQIRQAVIAMRDLQKKHAGHNPIIILGGDFNFDLERSLTLLEHFKPDFQEAFQPITQPLPFHETYTYFKPDSYPHFFQRLDGFVTNKPSQIRSLFTPRFSNEPRTPEEFNKRGRTDLASDHNPVVLDINL